MKEYIIDTNFILRYLLADNKEQYRKSKAVFDQVREGKIIIHLEQAVFVEVIFVLSSFYETPKERIIETIYALLSYKGLETEQELLQDALEIFQKNNIHIVDSIIAAKCNMKKIPTLTFDKKLEKLIEQ